MTARRGRDRLAEGVGFEPTVTHDATTIFKTVALGH
jgi:hypothetical protein